MNSSVSVRLLQRADKGIDGKILFRESPKDPKPQQVIFSVKGGGISVRDVRDLRGVVERDKAAIGVLLTMQEPTGPMKKEAAEAGFFSSAVWHKQYPRLQIYTVAELLAGRQVERPPTLALDETYKRAQSQTQSPRAAGTWDIIGIMSRLKHPSIVESAFNCPHCGVLTSQAWFALHAKEIGGDNPVPSFPGYSFQENVMNDHQLSEEERCKLIGWVEKVQEGSIFLDHDPRNEFLERAWNLHLSQCFHCRKMAVWVRDGLVHPVSKLATTPNLDLPEDVRLDFEEARGIVNDSPRGAAALLRLAVQKLCKFLGEKGKNIDDDIAGLVRKGLNPRVQQALDIVRVIGNEAVHPGTIDLNDDRDLAVRLFDLVNAIAEQMISHPKAVDELYAQLPEAKRKGIEARDKSQRTP